MTDLLFKEESYKIIGACFEVHKNLGCGFLESVYQEALEKEFITLKIPYLKEKILDIYYKDEKLDKFFVADFICYENIILELKAENSLSLKHEAQLINYLKATKMRLGLLINFGEVNLKHKRFINTKTQH